MIERYRPLSGKGIYTFNGKVRGVAPNLRGVAQKVQGIPPKVRASCSSDSDVVRRAQEAALKIVGPSMENPAGNVEMISELA